MLLGDIRKGIFESYMMLWALIAGGSGAKEVVTLAPPYFQVTEYPEKELMPSSQGSSFAWSPLGTSDQFSPVSSFNTLITLRYFPAPLEFQKRHASGNRGVLKFRILLLHELHGHF